MTQRMRSAILKPVARTTLRQPLDESWLLAPERALRCAAGSRDVAAGCASAEGPGGRPEGQTRRGREKVLQPRRGRRLKACADRRSAARRATPRPGKPGEHVALSRKRPPGPVPLPPDATVERSVGRMLTGAYRCHRRRGPTVGLTTILSLGPLPARHSPPWEPRDPLPAYRFLPDPTVEPSQELPDVHILRAIDAMAGGPPDTRLDSSRF